MEAIRDNFRGAKLQERTLVRNSTIEKVRKIDPKEVIVDITTNDAIICYGKLLQKKSAVTPELLVSLKNSFLEHPRLIKAFLSVESSLISLLRIFNGQDANTQLLSAECVCNIALSGDKQINFLIAKMFGPYFSGYLESFLSETCLWIIGNLSCCEKSIQTLQKQGVYTKVQKLLHTADEQIMQAVEYCLKFYIYHGFDLIPEKDVLEITAHCVCTRTRLTPGLLHILSLLSGKPEAQNVISTQSEIHEKLFSRLISWDETELTTIVCIMRIFANTIPEPTGEFAKKLLQITTFEKTIYFLLNWKFDFVKNEILWLIGNLLTHSIVEVREQSLVFFKNYL